MIFDEMRNNDLDKKIENNVKINEDEHFKKMSC